MNKSPDRRMCWIRNLEGIREGKETTSVAYELGSESRIGGVLDYGESSVLCSPLTLEPNGQGLFKYLLKLRTARFDPFATVENASKDGYLSRGGLIGELIGILSIALETRFFVLSVASGELGPHGIMVRNEYNPIHRSCTKEIDPVIVSPRKRSFHKDVPPILDMVSKVDAIHHNDLCLAFFHYAKALREIAIDDEMVFIRLVSAIEVVDRSTKIQGDMGVLACRPLSEIIRDENLDKEELQEARKIFEVRASQGRFISFLHEYSKGFFKGGRSKAPHTRIKKGDLAKRARAIYQARSIYLHSGIPMYLSTRLRGEHRWHIDPSMGMILGDRQFSDVAKLPYTYWFHALVRHCLINYVNSLIKGKGITYTT